MAAGRLPSVLLVLNLTGATLTAGVGGTPGGQLALLTQEEASLLRLSDQDTWSPAPRVRGLADGPRIVVQRPKVVETGGAATIETDSPTAFYVRFEARRAPIDMHSLEIRAWKGWFSKSLTDRLAPYVDGTRLIAEGVTIPEGRYVIEITIRDRKGAETKQNYELIVRN